MTKMATDDWQKSATNQSACLAGSVSQRSLVVGKTTLPFELIHASRTGNLVIFAGAGVSMQEPVSLPSFASLVMQIRDRVDPGHFLENWQPGVAPERYLGYLAQSSRPVLQACSDLIGSVGGHTRLHEKILSVFPSSSAVQIVTTNFDTCFEDAAASILSHPNSGWTETPVAAAAPDLPDGHSFEGIVHIHGIHTEIQGQVLTDAQYGQAYVTDGWASRFLVELFSSHTVLFVGYSCGDTPIDYLTKALSSAKSTKAYVLERDHANFGEWRRRGVEPLYFEDFDNLPEIFARWSQLNDLTSSLETVTCLASESRLGYPKRTIILSPEDSSFLAMCLDPHTSLDAEILIDTFITHARTSQWVHWLMVNGCLNWLDDSRVGPWAAKELAWILRTAQDHHSISSLKDHLDHCRVSSDAYDRLLGVLASNKPNHLIDDCLMRLVVRSIRPDSVSAAARFLSHCTTREHTLALARACLDKCIVSDLDGDTKPLDDFPVDKFVGCVSHAAASESREFEVLTWCYDALIRSRALYPYTRPASERWVDPNELVLSLLPTTRSRCATTTTLGIVGRLAFDMVLNCDSSHRKRIVDVCMASHDIALVRFGLAVKATELNSTKLMADAIESLKRLLAYRSVHIDILTPEVAELVLAAYSFAAPEQLTEILETIDELCAPDVAGTPRESHAESLSELYRALSEVHRDNLTVSEHAESFLNHNPSWAELVSIEALCGTNASDAPPQGFRALAASEAVLIGEVEDDALRLLLCTIANQTVEDVEWAIGQLEMVMARNLPSESGSALTLLEVTNPYMAWDRCGRRYLSILSSAMRDACLRLVAIERLFDLATGHDMLVESAACEEVCKAINLFLTGYAHSPVWQRDRCILWLDSSPKLLSVDPRTELSDTVETAVEVANACISSLARSGTNLSFDPLAVLSSAPPLCIGLLYRETVLEIASRNIMDLRMTDSDAYNTLLEVVKSDLVPEAAAVWSGIVQYDVLDEFCWQDLKQPLEDAIASEHLVIEMMQPPHSKLLRLYVSCSLEHGEEKGASRTIYGRIIDSPMYCHPLLECCCDHVRRNWGDAEERMIPTWLADILYDLHYRSQELSDVADGITKVLLDECRGQIEPWTDGRAHPLERVYSPPIAAAPVSPEV